MFLQGWWATSYCLEVIFVVSIFETVCWKRIYSYKNKKLFGSLILSVMNVIFVIMMAEVKEKRGIYKETVFYFRS